MRVSLVALMLIASFSSLFSATPYFVQEAKAQTDSAESDAYNTSAGPVFTLPQWTDGAGWSATEYYSTIQLADINGDGADELLARGPNGMTVQSWDAKRGFWTPLSHSGPFEDAAGWGEHAYYSTIQTADIDGDGAAELLGRSSVGMISYKWNGSGWTMLASGSPDFGDSSHWNKPQYYETIQTADINGDGKAELLARNAGGMATYAWSGKEWDLLVADQPAWRDGTPKVPDWDDRQYFKTIQTADINGDGKAELLARGFTGLQTWEWADSTWKLLKTQSPAFRTDGGWSQPQYYLTIQTADIDGDGSSELLARGVIRMETYKWKSGKWESLKSASPAWSDHNGWLDPAYYFTIQTADIDGDGTAELLSRAFDGMETYSWNGEDWTRLVHNQPQLSNAHWSSPENYLTIQAGDIDGDRHADLVARGLYGIRTWSYNASSSTGWGRPNSFGFQPFTDDAAPAYEFINQFLTLSDGQQLRAQYGTDANTLSNYQRCLLSKSVNNEWVDWTELPSMTCEILGGGRPLSPPTDLTLEAWNRVAKQLFGELGQAQLVSDFYADLLTLHTSIYEDGNQELDSVSQRLLGENMSTTRIETEWEDLLLAPLALGQLLGPVGSVLSELLTAGIQAAIEASGGDSFQGTLAEAVTEYAARLEANKDGINDSWAYVVRDAELMGYVAEQKSSGAWDPRNDWVTRYLTSEGRRGTALWVYQTLSPTVWQVFEVTYQANACRDEHDSIYTYIPGTNAVCWYEVATAGLILNNHPPEKSWRNIIDPISDSCKPRQDNTATWEYVQCSLGESKADVLIGKNGWRMPSGKFCVDCEGPYGADAAISSATGTLSLSDPGQVQLIIFGKPEFDAPATVPSSLVFAGASPVGWWGDDETWHDARVIDANDDGYDDVIASFPVNQMTNINVGDTAAELSGELDDGTGFRFLVDVDITA